MDDNNSLAFAVLNFMELADLSLIYDIAFIASIGINPAQNIHQGRFSRAILADKRMDFTFLDLQIDIIQRADARKPLHNIFHLKQDIYQLNPPPKSGNETDGRKLSSARPKTAV